MKVLKLFLRLTILGLNQVRLRFTGSVLQQKTATYHKKVVNIYIVYEVANFHNISN